MYLEPAGVGIGPGARIGADVALFAATSLGSNEGAPGPSGCSTLGGRVQMYASASVFDPWTIGDDAKLDAHTLVVRDVPPGAVARGVPARVFLPGVEVPRAGQTAA